MTPVFCCGFECGLLVSAGSHWTGGGSFSISTTTVRTGARALRCNPTAATSRAATTITTSATHVGRMYLRFASLPTADVGVNYYANTTVGPRIQFKQSDSKLYAAVGTTLGASGVSVTTGVWYRVDWKFVIAGAPPDTCDVQVDGVACGQASAVTGQGTSGLVSLGFSEAATADLFIDDVILSVTDADYPIGAGSVQHFVPTSDGTHNIAGSADFQRGNTAVDILNATTTAWQLIDDVPLPSGSVDAADNLQAVAPVNATDYVECVFGPASGISTPTTAPRAVDIICAHHQLSTVSGNIRIALNDNGTVDDVLNLTAAGVVTYRYIRKHYADPPSAASAWTVTAGDGNFNNVRLRFYSSDADPDQCLDAAMIEAEFAAAAGQPFVRRFGGIPHAAGRISSRSW